MKSGKNEKRGVQRSDIYAYEIVLVLPDMSRYWLGAGRLTKMSQADLTSCIQRWYEAIRILAGGGILDQ